MEYTAAVLAELQARVTANAWRWGLSPDTTARLLNVSENATYLLSEPGGGRELILRVHRVGYSTAEEIRSELTWIEALRDAVVIETAAPLQGTDDVWVQRLGGTGLAPARFAVAFEYVSGQEPEARNALHWFERLGEATARMHDHASSWPLPAGFKRKRWDLPSMVGSNAHWGSWRAGIGLEPHQAAVIEQALDLIQGRLARFGMGRSVFGLVHADLRLANLLVDGERLRIIDFDDCGFSWYLYDFATAVSFFEHEPRVPALLDAWLAGYRRVRTLGAAERAEIPTFVVLRRIMLTAWLASHREVPLAQELGAGFTAGTAALAESLLDGRFLSNGG